MQIQKIQKDKQGEVSPTLCPSANLAPLCRGNQGTYVSNQGNPMDLGVDWCECSFLAFYTNGSNLYTNPSLSFFH